MDTESRQEQLDLTDARYPVPPVCDDVVGAVLARRWETRANPPLLGVALRKARELELRDSVQALDDALLDVAVAALDTLEKFRRTVPALTRRRR